MRKQPARWFFMILTSLVVHYAGTFVVLGQDSGTKQVSTVESQAFSIPEERSAGRKEAPIVIEVFSDFQCAGCAEFYLRTLTRVIEEYCESAKVYLIHREYPLAIHRYARDAARWALASAAIGKYEQAAARCSVINRSGEKTETSRRPSHRC